MNYRKALCLLNLNENFTEEDLKKSYRKLMTIYHPDKNINNQECAEEKTKEINEARTLLIDYLKNKKRFSNNSYQNNQESEVRRMKIRMTDEVLHEIQEINKIDNKDKIFINHKIILLNIISNFLDKLSVNNNKSIIEALYQKYKQEYLIALVIYRYDFSVTSHVTILNTSEKYSSIKELRSLLILQVESILRKELHKYINYRDYNEIINILLTYKEVYILRCLYGYLNIDITKQEFNKKIIKEFMDYQKRKKILEGLMYDKEIVNSQTFMVLRETIGKNPEAFYNAYDKLDYTTKIKSKIRRLISFNK